MNEQRAMEIIRSISEERCTCDTSGNTSTRDGMFCPDRDCPVHGLDVSDFQNEIDAIWKRVA